MNTNFLQKILVLFLVVSASSLVAQVSFTNQGSLLNPAGGGGSPCAVDMNGDYLDDVVRIGSGAVFIDYQQADGTFTQGIFDINLQNSPSWSIAAGDIDGNGFNDLLLGDGDAVSFVYANDTGTMYTEDAKSEYIFSQRSTFADIDNDGHLDAFVCHDVDQSHPYRNDGSGNLVLDQTLIETIDQPGNYAAIWVDYDNDWDSDLYITKCRGGASPGDPTRTNRMYRNNGDGTFSEVGEEIGLADNAQSWATVFEDFDNDGDFDAFTVNHDFQNRFYINNGDGTFTDIIQSTGINPNSLGAWENTAADFNNDGYIDILAQLNDELYLNNGDLTFTAVQLPLSSGGLGDFNGDGFVDVTSGSSLWINDGNDNNYIKINTQGIFSNQNGIGARVEIYGDWGVQIREVRSGTSFSPMSSLSTYFGIGQATSIDQVVVKWPSGIITTLDDPAINSAHTIVETECLLPQAELTVNGSTEICPNETVELVAPDGYEGYTWSNGQTGESISVSEQGSYSVILEDPDGCVALVNPVQITVVDITAPTASIVGDDVVCEGETVTLTSSDGENHMWSNGMTGQTIEVSTSGEYFVMVDANCATGQVSSETINISVIEAPAPIVNDVVINEVGTAVLSATGENLTWYDVPTGGVALGQGPTFETPEITADATFFVESTTITGGSIANGGKPDNAGGGGLPSTGAYSFFDAYEAFTILNVTVYVPAEAGAGVRTIQLVDENDTVLEEAQFNLELGQQLVELNFEVPAGNQHSLRCVENNLFRNSDSVSYPYAIGEVGSITNSFYGETYYYYFYNWEVQEGFIECVSDRVEVNVSLVNIEDLDIKGLSIYPNPTQDMLYIEFDSKDAAPVNIRVLDILGKQVNEYSLNKVQVGSNQHVIDFSDLPKGMYSLQFTVNDKTASKTIAVQ